MGAGSSIEEQKALFHSLVDLNKKSEREEEEDESDESENALYEQTNKVIKEWNRRRERLATTIYSELIELEKNLDKALTANLTPLILDRSSDDRVCTFFSYQPDAIILEAKQLVILEGASRGAKSRGSREYCLEIARKTLVNAMKHGKLLVIRLGTTAPDFIGKFTDDSHFPLEVFFQAGAALRSEEWVQKLFREDDSFPHKNFAICR